MQAYTLHSKNESGLTHLTLQETPIPTPKADEVLVKISAIVLNPVDYKLINAPLPSFNYPHIFGLDGAGIVTAVGTNVKKFHVGDRVCGHNNLHNDGTFAEYATFPEYCLAKIPDNVTFNTAAALLCGALTAYQALFRKMNLAGKKTILIHAGSGGVGSIAIQLAKLKNLDVITTVSPAKKNFVSTLHPDKIIDYKNESVTDEVQKFTGGVGADLILNTVSAGESHLDITERLSYNGQIVCVVDTPTFTDNSFLEERGLTISSLNLGGVHMSNSSAQKNDLGTMTAELLNLASQNLLDPCITEVLPFSNLIDGLKKLENRQSIGKIIIERQ